MNSKTIDPQLTQINLFYKKDFYDKASNFLSTINNYSTELQTSIDYNLTKVQNDVITSQKDFFIKLDNQMKSMQPQFAADWISKFNTALNEVKNQVRVEINEGTFYKQFSDSIGSLARLENYLDDSLQLVSDVTGSKMMTPLRYGASLTNKMSPSTQLLHAELSKKTNMVFRKNIQNIQSTVQSGNVSQGSNLTPDTQHFVRMKNAIPSLNEKIQSEFKELYNVIQLYCNYNPRSATNNIQFVPKTNISVNVEGNTLNQDLLFNQLKEVTSSVTTRKVLGVS